MNQQSVTVEALDRMRSLLAQFRFNFSTEAELQNGIDRVLRASTYQYTVEREHRIEGVGRLDFLVNGCIAIEVKVDGSAAALMRQVARYASCEEIAGILVVTNRARHVMPESFNGKRVMVHSLIGGGL
jgi:hypothetical protein